MFVPLSLPNILSFLYLFHLLQTFQLFYLSIHLLLFSILLLFLDLQLFPNLPKIHKLFLSISIIGVAISISGVTITISISISGGDNIFDSINITRYKQSIKQYQSHLRTLLNHNLLINTPLIKLSNHLLTPPDILVHLLLLDHLIIPPKFV